MKPWFVTFVEERAVPIGGSTYASHPGCTDSRKAWVYNNPDGCGFYCNKCGGKGFHRHGPRSLRESLAVQRRDADAAALRECVLPSDFTLEVPSEGAAWLLRAGIGQHRAEAVGIGWSEHLRRVILPVYSGRILTYWQGRAVHSGHQPKYINPNVSKEEVLYWPDEQPDTDQPAVVCEDILSAVRVSGAGHQCCSILGTKLSLVQAAHLGQHPRVDIWLDPDGAGQRGASKIRKELQWFTTVRIIHSTADPKTYTNYQIKEYLT